MRTVCHGTFAQRRAQSSQRCIPHIQDPSYFNRGGSDGGSWSSLQRTDSRIEKIEGNKGGRGHTEIARARFTTSTCLGRPHIHLGDQAQARGAQRRVPLVLQEQSRERGVDTLESRLSLSASSAPSSQGQKKVLGENPDGSGGGSRLTNAGSRARSSENIDKQRDWRHQISGPSSSWSAGVRRPALAQRFESKGQGQRQSILSDSNICAGIGCSSQLIPATMSVSADDARDETLQHSSACGPLLQDSTTECNDTSKSSQPISIKKKTTLHR